MRYAFEERWHLGGLLVDRLLYWAVTKIRARALKKGRFQHLFVPMDDTVGMRVFATGEYESTHVAAIQTLIESSHQLLGFKINTDAVCVDVGANIGLYSIVFSGLFRHVLALEANPVTAKVLEANIAVAGLDNVSCICRGVSASSGEVLLHVPNDGNFGWSTIEPNQSASNSNQLAIQTATLDDILASCEFAGEPIALIKIDVEGHELSVLRGSTRTLQRWNPIVVFEMIDSSLGCECMAFLRGLGYASFYRFRRNLRGAAASWRETAENLVRGLPVRLEPLDNPGSGHETLVLATKDPARATRSSGERRSSGRGDVPLRALNDRLC
ncbi:MULTISPECIES: FkbM family methyltransferase [unclassified Bradyrhizobium]|uniref:FkbM family methyltransferase n=1 Tax=unclassified Bradyrhizobium TaxID=2631580 RepID=UPI002479BAA7|nr:MULTISPECIES: FkbM family methyltransferase [unclassified Bradyrhizobium]WGR68655.1 FkbM family methyltransferase [Bradyrhizobium sp. ISRA426]WGR80710.1 FkbM family methyltransferase [Bradyrhizobium sp. ISRA430]WGR83895.1 FkbM family methyltransferase [Bradyrhizobium sp. ISRA432]